MYCAPNSQSYDFTSMFDMTDKRGILPITKPCPGTLLDVIENTPDFSKFNYLVKLANQQEVLNSSQANFTIFVPSDKMLRNISDNVFTNMDATTAWYIVKSSMIKNKIPSEILEDSPAAYFYTLSEANRLAIAEGIADLREHGTQCAGAVMAQPEADRIEHVTEYAWKSLQPDRAICAIQTVTGK